jgi:hypothetical protein
LDATVAELKELTSEPRFQDSAVSCESQYIDS